MRNYRERSLVRTFEAGGVGCIADCSTVSTSSESESAAAIAIVVIISTVNAISMILSGPSLFPQPLLASKRSTFAQPEMLLS